MLSSGRTLLVCTLGVGALGAGCRPIELMHGTGGAGTVDAKEGDAAATPLAAFGDDAAAAAALAGLTMRLEAVTVPVTAPSPPPGVDVTTGPPVWVDVTYVNGGMVPVRLLSRMLPSEALWEDLFAVTLNGEPLPYVGRVYRRAATTDADFTTLAPGQSAAGRVNLARLYDLPATGDYQVWLRADGARLAGVAAAGAPRLESNRVALTIPGRVRMRGPLPGPAPEERGESYYGISYAACDSAQKTSLRAGLTAATAQARDAAAHLGQATPGQSARYAAWFGPATGTRWATVKATFDALVTRVAAQPVTFHCDCAAEDAGRAYGYVYADQPLDVHVCGLYWGAAAAEQAATVVHELTHFHVVGGTGDVAFGASACKHVAESDPDGAVVNAESYGYF